MASTNVDVQPSRREGVAELGQRPAVELARRDDVIARFEQRVERQQLGGVAGRRGDRGTPAFERRDALLERGHGRVGDARVDVAEGLEVEQGGRVVDVVEDVGGRLVDRDVARAGDGVGPRAGVDGPRLEAVGLVDLERRPRARRGARPVTRAAAGGGSRGAGC